MVVATVAATPPKTIGCQQTTLEDEFEELAAYLAKEKAPKAVRNAFKWIYDAYAKRVDKQATSDAIRTLQEAVQKLTAKIEAKPVGPNATGLSGSSYAAAAQRGAATAPQSHTEPSKLVLACHKCEITVSRGQETPIQTQHSGKELVEQLNSVGIRG
jgi:hypothetical protein